MILAVELNKKDSGNVIFNVSTLHTIALAFPRESIWFVAQKPHLEMVRNFSATPSLPNVSFHPIPEIPQQVKGSFKWVWRFICQWRALRGILNKVAGTNAV